MRAAGGLLALTLFAAGCGHGALVPVGPNGERSWRTSIPHAPQYAVIYRFGGGKDGYEPQATLAVDASGTMYGTTTQGGNGQNDGTVFKITPSGKKTTLYAFKGGPDGASPIGGLIVDGKGNLFGTTSAEASTSCPYGCGTVFELEKTAAHYREKVLYRFGTAPDGSTPYGTLVNVNGVLFGTTVAGGTGNGTVFKLTPAGGGYKESVLWRFAGGSKDGAKPFAGLTPANGTFYGTTIEGGNANDGTIFSITQSGKKKVLYNFQGSTLDSFAPHDAPLAIRGRLYGTAASGGAQNAGTVFRYKSGHEKILYAFETNSTSDGQTPTATPIAINGAFYGTTEDGGGTAYGYGAVYKLVPAAGGKYAETLLHAFGTTQTDGLSATAGLTPYKGYLYGVTRFGGGTSCSQGCGTFFKIKP